MNYNIVRSKISWTKEKGKWKYTGNRCGFFFFFTQPTRYWENSSIVIHTAFKSIANRISFAMICARDQRVGGDLHSTFKSIRRLRELEKKQQSLAYCASCKCVSKCHCLSRIQYGSKGAPKRCGRRAHKRKKRWIRQGAINRLASVLTRHLGIEEHGHLIELFQCVLVCLHLH